MPTVWIHSTLIKHLSNKGAEKISAVALLSAVQHISKYHISSEVLVPLHLAQILLLVDKLFMRCAACPPLPGMLQLPAKVTWKGFSISLSTMLFRVKALSVCASILTDFSHWLQPGAF